MNEAERLQSGEGSKFNSALADLQRIDLILQRCNNASTMHDYHLWCSSLNALYRELSPYMNDKEQEAANKLRIVSLPREHNNFFHKRLDDFEFYLRKIRAIKKLGIVADEDASTAAMR